MTLVPDCIIARAPAAADSLPAAPTVGVPAPCRSAAAPRSGHGPGWSLRPGLRLYTAKYPKRTQIHSVRAATPWNPPVWPSGCRPSGQFRFSQSSLCLNLKSSFPLQTHSSLATPIPAKNLGIISVSLLPQFPHLIPDLAQLTSFCSHLC